LVLAERRDGRHHEKALDVPGLESERLGIEVGVAVLFGFGVAPGGGPGPTGRPTREFLTGKQSER
jgi:hypothetical protein